MLAVFLAGSEGVYTAATYTVFLSPSVSSRVLQHMVYLSATAPLGLFTRIHNNPIKRKQHNFGVGLGTQLSTRPGMFLFIVGSFVCTRYSVTNMKRSSERQQEDNIAVTTFACEKFWSPGEHC